MSDPMVQSPPRPRTVWPLICAMLAAAVAGLAVVCVSLHSERTSLQETVVSLEKEKELRKFGLAEFLKSVEEIAREQAAKAHQELRDFQQKIHESEQGYQVISRKGITLYYPPALAWLVSKQQATELVERAHAAVVSQFGNFDRAVKVRLVTTPLSRPGIPAEGLFQNQGDEILICPTSEGVQFGTLVHELCHAWLWQRFAGALPLPLDEGISYAAGEESPAGMFNRIETTGGVVSKEALLRALPSTEKKRRQVEGSAWLVVYYLRCVLGLEYSEIARMNPKDLPEPKDVLDAAWAHHQLVSNIGIFVGDPFASQWLDLAELGPLTEMELKRFDRKDVAMRRRLMATQQLLLHQFQQEKLPHPKSYTPIKELPKLAEVWKLRKAEVYEEMFRYGQGASLQFPFGVSLRHLGCLLLQPPVSKEEFLAAAPSPELRERCEATLWALSVRSVYCEGEVYRPFASRERQNLSVEGLRELAIGTAGKRLTEELFRRPWSILKLR